MSATQDEAEPSALTQPRTRVGRFTYNTLASIWDWDDEVFRIHGLEPWSITPTTEYMLTCKVPEDRERVADVLARAQTDGMPFSATYRLDAADGVERTVLIVCEAGARLAGDTVTAINGYYVDLTDDFRHENELAAHQAVTESAEHRATIEQAVGGLMVAYGLDADQAFGMLRWWSQNRNVKVRELAARLIEAASKGTASGHKIRMTYDALLHDLTATRSSSPAAPVPGSRTDGRAGDSST